MLDFGRKIKLTDDFPSAGVSFSCPGEFFLIGTRIFSHGHENSVCSWCRSAGQRVGRRDVAPSLILSAAQNPLSLLLIYRATSKGSAGAVGTPRGAPPAFSVDEGGRPSRRWGVDLRAGGQRQGTGRDSRILSAPAAVPARRGGRSGATASPFRRDGIAVPARPGRPLAQKANSDGRQKATLTLRPAASHDPPATLRASKYHLSSPRVGAAVPCRPRAAACLRRAKCVVSA